MNTNNFIMDAQGAELSLMITRFLGKLDDLMQEAGEHEDFEISEELQKDYMVIESYLEKAKQDTITREDRNTIRLIMKHNLGLYAC